MRYFIEVSYDGTHFHGSQVQAGQITVQGSLDRALSTLLRQNIATFGASRTDEGVHALCNFYHFDFEGDLLPELRYKLNAVLPWPLSVKHVYKALHPEANARFDALSRSYRYRIYPSKDPFLYQKAFYYPYSLDRFILDLTAEAILQYEDFEAFSKRNTQSKTFRCHIFRSYWEQQGKELHYVVEANRFLRGMVRALVGTQLQAARGKHSLEGFHDLVRAKDCSRADFSVPGHGLYLEQVRYPEGLLEPWAPVTANRQFS